MAINDSLLTSDGNGNHSHANATNTVDLTTVVLSCMFMFFFGLVGLLANLTLLVATRCKRSIQSLKYGLLYAVSIVDILLCVLWIPLAMVTTVRSYRLEGSHTVVCHLQTIVLTYCMSLIVFLCISITIQRLCQLRWDSTQSTNKCVLGCGLASIVLASVITLATGTEYSSSPDFEICVYGQGSSTDVYATLLAKSVVFLFSLLAVILGFVIIMSFKRMRVGKNKGPKEMCSKTAPRKNLKFQEVNTVDIDDSRQNVSNVSDSQVSNEPSSSSQKSTKSTKSKSSKKFVGFMNLKKDKDNVSDCSDDDQFDLKMKMRLQKTGSGRRHTVANIGLNECPLSGRRRSLGESGGSNASNYQYVRKWSVDITALQKQLENPKLMGQGNPFAEFSKFKEKAAKEKAARDTSLQETSVEEHPNEDDHEDDQKIEEIDQPDDALCSTGLIPSSPTIPSIVVNGNNVGDKTNNKDNKKSKFADVRKKLLAENIGTLSVCLLLLVTVFLLTLPYATLQIMQLFMHTNQNRNCTYLAATLFILQTPFHPVLITLMESKIYEALKKLRFNLTHWKCVCYCNIGKGKGCFEHPRQGIEENPVSASTST